jgi:hypothetical protein
MSRNAVIVAIVAARIATTQAFPPAAGIGFAEDASALLERAREKVLSSIRRMPKYTCLETIDRQYYVPSPEKHILRGMSEPPSSACMGNRAGPLSLAAKDRLRVEVAESSEGEIHSWPGASHFDTRSIDQVIPFGPISTGSFGADLLDILANSGAQLKFIARKVDGRQVVFAYSFRVPRKTSHSVVKTQSGWKTTGNSGSFEIDAATAELARLVIETDPLPPDTGMCQAKTTIDYHFIEIGDGEFLIPRRSEFETFNTDDSRTDSVTEFSTCREYMVQSGVRFDDEDASAGSVNIAPQHVTPLPPGVSLTLAFVRAIDLGTAAAGDAVSATVVSSIRVQGSNDIPVPPGAIARGRIVGMRYEFSTAQFVISIRFETLETNGALSPLSLRLDRGLKADRRTAHGFVTRGTEFSLPAPASVEPGNILVFPVTSGAYVIPAGFQSKWTTVAP